MKTIWKTITRAIGILVLTATGWSTDYVFDGNVCISNNLTVARGLTVTSSTNVSSASGYALQFNGSSSYTETATNAAFFPQSAMTLEAWVNTSFTGDGDIVGTYNTTDDGYMIEFYYGLPYFVVETGSGQVHPHGPESIAMNDGQWHHLAAVWDGSYATMYVDGVPGETLECSGVAVGTKGIRLGNCYRGEFWFPGHIDEVRLSSVARYTGNFSGQIPTSFDPNATGTVAYWKFDEGTGSTAADSSGNNHTMTHYGANWVPKEGENSKVPTGSLVFTPEGNLGVGTNAPAARVHMVGDVRIDDKLTVSGETRLYHVEPLGDISMGSFTNSP